MLQLTLAPAELMLCLPGCGNADTHSRLSLGATLLLCDPATPHSVVSMHTPNLHGEKHKTAEPFKPPVKNAVPAVLRSTPITILKLALSPCMGHWTGLRSFSLPHCSRYSQVAGTHLHGAGVVVQPDSACAKHMA